jgi:hypothetical protein
MISHIERDRFAEQIAGRLPQGKLDLYERARAAGMRPHDALKAAQSDHRHQIEEAERKGDAAAHARAAAQQLPDDVRSLYESFGGDTAPESALRRALGREPEFRSPFTEAIDRVLLTPPSDEGRDELVESFAARGFAREKAERMATGSGRSRPVGALVQAAASSGPTPRSPAEYPTKLVVSVETGRRVRQASLTRYGELADQFAATLPVHEACEAAEQVLLREARANGMLGAAEVTEVVVDREAK